MQEFVKTFVTDPFRARRLTDAEGRRLLQIVRRGKHGSVWGGGR